MTTVMAAKPSSSMALTLGRDLLDLAMDLAHALQDHPVALWAAEDEPGPLLDVHDGPMYADVEGPSSPLDVLDGPASLDSSSRGRKSIFGLVTSAFSPKLRRMPFHP